MNWVSQASVPMSRRPNHAFAHLWDAALWALDSEGAPVACVHPEGLCTLAEPGQPMVWGASILMGDGSWMGFPESWSTDINKVREWAEAKIATIPPRQLSMFANEISPRDQAATDDLSS